MVRIEKQNKNIGGGAANVVSVLSKLNTGVPLWPVGAIGNDEYGEYILAHCSDLNLSTEYFAIKDDTPSAHTHVISVINHNRTFLYQGGANDALDLEDFPEKLFQNTKAKIFYLGYLTLLNSLDRKSPDGTTPSADLLAKAQAAGMQTCVDLVSLNSSDFADRLSPALPYIDYLIINEIELARASGNREPAQGEVPTDTELIGMSKNLLAAGVKKSVVVHCPQKAVWVGSDGSIEIIHPSQLAPEHIISRLGAGDAFCAGALYAIHEGWSPQRTLDLATRVARKSLCGLTASQAIPPLREFS